MKIPTQKGEHSCTCTELSLKWLEGIDTKSAPVTAHYIFGTNLLTWHLCVGFLKLKSLSVGVIKRKIRLPLL